MNTRHKDFLKERDSKISLGAMAFKMNIKLPLRGEFLLISRFEIVSSINFSKNQLEIGMISLVQS